MQFPSPETAVPGAGASLLDLALASGRIHAAYLVAGPTGAARALALRFVRGLVCRGPDPAARPCEACPDCHRSSVTAPGHEAVTLDGAGKKGPLYRHVGDHPDLVWVERGADDTRVRVAQIRALQGALRLRAHEGGWRAAVVADAEWLNAEAQNALLRTLEEPPPRTVVVLVAATAASLLATVRSRCQRVVLPPPAEDPCLADDAPEDVVALRERLREAGRLELPALLDFAEELRGARAEAAEAAVLLLDVGCALLHERVRRGVAAGRRDLRAELDAYGSLRDARRSLVRFNANPQMVAERALLALRGALA